MRLDQLPDHQRAQITHFEAEDPAIEAKLREIGFAEDDEVEIIHRGPLRARPLCIRLNRTMIALRPEEAAYILVKELA